MSSDTTRPLDANGTPVSLASDLLHGAQDIAEFLYGTPSNSREAVSNQRRVYHAIEKHHFPAFKLGGVICARKSTILKWIEAKEHVNKRVQ
jgi:hypothetical protein